MSNILTKLSACLNKNNHTHLNYIPFSVAQQNWEVRESLRKVQMLK